MRAAGHFFCVTGELMLLRLSFAAQKMGQTSWEGKAARDLGERKKAPRLSGCGVPSGAGLKRAAARARRKNINTRKDNDDVREARAESRKQNFHLASGSGAEQLCVFHSGAARRASHGESRRAIANWNSHERTSLLKVGVEEFV